MPELWWYGNTKTSTGNGITATINEDNTITLTGTATARSLFYFKPFNLTFKAGTYQYISNAPGADLRIESTLIANNTTYYRSSYNNIPNELTAQDSFKIESSVLVISQGQVTNTTLYFFIQEKNEDISYVPHQEQNYPFTFTEGQRAMQGTTLEDDGIHNIRKQRVLDGTETGWFQNSYATKENTVGFGILLNNIALKNTGELGYLCDKFMALPASNWSADIQGVVQMNDKTLLFKINKSSLITENVAGFKTWLSSNNITVEYELETEEIIPYNATQQAQYDAIKEATSYDDITIISSESDELGFDMKAIAVADANKVIDSELQEIKSAVIALGGDLNV